MSRLVLLQLLAFLFISATPVYDKLSPGSFEGIDIVFDTEPRMFPSNWYCKRIHAEAVSLPKTYRAQAMDILNRAIAKYPEEVLFAYLKKVYVMQSMNFFGVPYGGTNAREMVYLAYENSSPGFSAEYLEGVFHHEFSSVLLRKFQKEFDEEGWLKANPSGFRYGEGGVQAIKNGEASMEYDLDLHPSGFLNKYSLSAREEDFNVFAQNLFSGGLPFWNIVDTYPSIREKTSLMIRFYHRIDPVFTEEYFRALAYPG